jgi:hypothetical protein
MEEIFGPGGLIAQHHPNYEYRPGQVEMAEAVNNILSDGGVSLIEAGTGTGKTLAYLIPALPEDGSSFQPRPRTSRNNCTRKTFPSFSKSFRESSK